MRQALAAELLVAGETDPTALDQRLVGFLETLRRGDAAVGVALAALMIAAQVQRLDHFLDKLRPLRQHRLDDVDRRVGEAGRIGVFRIVEDVTQQE